jgi:molecular chaperone HscB
VHVVPADQSPFELLGLPVAFAIDERDARRRATRFARLVHPDFFGAADAATRALAEHNSALLNRAAETIVDPWQRADWIVTRWGGPREGDARALPPAFLAEVLEWNETLEAAREDAAAAPYVDALATDLAGRRAASLAALARALATLPPASTARLVEARRELDVLRYVDRALREVEAQRLQRAEKH